jgi:thymidylate kinase
VRIFRKRGMLITFSGIDGAGKSTQIQVMLRALQNAGHRPVYLWTRGGYTPGFELLKVLLRWLSRGHALPPRGRSAHRQKAFTNPLVRKAWLSLAVFDLLLVYAVYIRWLTFTGSAVVCDRYLWDTQIDFVLNFPMERVTHWPLWKLLTWLTPRPDASFLLLVPVAESVRRSGLKNEPFPDSADVLKQRLERYQELPRLVDIEILDGQASISDLAGRIWTRIDFALAAKTGKTA